MGLLILFVIFLLYWASWKYKIPKIEFVLLFVVLYCCGKAILNPDAAAGFVAVGIISAFSITGIEWARRTWIFRTKE